MITFGASFRGVYEAVTAVTQRLTRGREGGQVQIFVRIPNGKTITLELSPTETVHSVKKKVQLKTSESFSIYFK